MFSPDAKQLQSPCNSKIKNHDEEGICVCISQKLLLTLFVITH